MLTILADIPVPHDIPLPMPIDRVLLQAVIIVLFLAHIVFVNLMLGSAIFALVFEFLGRRRPDFDVLAREITKTVTVNKSMAVVLGVGPLLAINLLYTVNFYSANALTGYAWISIVPLVACAFLLLYLYKYTWDRLAGRKGLHRVIGAAGLAILLFIPLIFLANINLMLFPERWTGVKGFSSALLLPNALPRYVHFLLASIAVNALFLLGWFTRRSYPVESVFSNLDRAALRRLFYVVACGASLLQLFAGPLVYFTLPRQGVTWMLNGLVILAAALAIAMIGLMWWEVLSDRRQIGRYFVPVVALMVLTGSCMGYARHVYREEATREHRQDMARRTDDYSYAKIAAQWRADHGVTQEKLPLGQRVFRDSCSSCHALDQVLVGPPIREIAEIYRDNAAGIVAWAKAPGKKRTGFPQMPALGFPDAHLKAAAEYMLQLAGPGAASKPGNSRPSTQGAAP